MGKRAPLVGRGRDGDKDGRGEQRLSMGGNSEPQKGAAGNPIGRRELSTGGEGGGILDAGKSPVFSGTMGGGRRPTRPKFPPVMRL